MATSTDAGTVNFTLDGDPVAAREGETILQAALRLGREIPHLCYKDGLRADGNCRACVVEIGGADPRPRLLPHARRRHGGRQCR